MLNFSLDTVTPERKLANPPYRLDQLTDDSIMAAANTVYLSEDSHIQMIYEQGQPGAKN